jgi:Dyp-type peroxidase family
MTQSETPVCPHASAAMAAAAAARTEADLSTHRGNDTSHEIWRQVQRGLVYPAPHAVFATFWHAPHGKPLTREVLRRVVKDVRAEIHRAYGSQNTTAIAGVGFGLWRSWCADEGLPVPAGMELRFPADGGEGSAVFGRSNGTFADSRGDLFFHVKSLNEAHCAAVTDFIRLRLEAEGCIDPSRTVTQAAATKSNEPDHMGGKVLGCRFSENLNNPTDPVSIQANALVGYEDAAHLGASYVLTQRFTINWDLILNMSPEQIEDLVGRTTDDILIPSRDTRSHIRSSRVQDAHGDTMQLLRLSLPFGRSPALDDDDLVAKGASRRDEAGIAFAAYARSARALEEVMDSQIGVADGFMRDRLLSNVRSDVGGLFYIPSVADLGLEPGDLGLDALPDAEDTHWARFPGVDWNRLDRHFKVRSDNGLMFYNHKDYLFSVSTMSGERREAYGPPSNRVTRLLANAFSRWQDNWYFDRSQQELKHLSAYVAEGYGEDKAREVMGLSIAERMGWTHKVSLGQVFASHAYGFRGRKRVDGNWINGADTYRVHPVELIVGATPNLGLGQGRYVIDYTRADEQESHFFQNLSYASGVGHVVPGFQRVLDAGLGALLDDVAAKRDGAADEKKRQFYAGVHLALEGVRDACLAYARLAGEMAAGMAETQAAERENLLGIQARMTHLSSGTPRTMLEAAQLIFTLHASLHLIGEPTAIGRLDQMLEPFYRADVDAGRLTDDEAQEIIDCFWIKVGEKVQLNRQFVEDHQPFGNLAMGGSSGAYPQGAANNQWIQQVTVGGTKPDGSPAYNAVTTFCLRAARRLPLNAPCLSLRVRSDTPREVLREAALALLAGGAHPILLNDDKIIPGLQLSGQNIGAGADVAARAEGCWTSDVSLEAARDYACDGCYEPQIAGQNWFTLGGLPTLLPLECALNQGKTWASAGPMWFRGTRTSYSSPPPAEIRSFDQLVDLFMEHLRLLYAKQVDGQLAGFGNAAGVCPSPLLSALMDDCLDKGLDIYEGGTRYNFIAPCFTALANTIDSLWAVRVMVFDERTACTSLPELVEAMLCDWGRNMAEPFVSTLAGPARIAGRAERFRELRQVALSLPRYGRGQGEIDGFGNELVQRVAETSVRVFTHPVPSTAQRMVDIARRLGTPEKPFGGFQVQPGVGTFENYVEFGAQFGASADGRHSGDPMASDLSAIPSPADLPVQHQETVFLDALKGYTGTGTDALWDGAPTDMTIREDFPVDALERVLAAFAAGQGSNILTITCANPETFAGAAKNPEKYDLVRVRMGGWSEFFVAMFPAHQEQHQRRPLSTPEKAPASVHVGNLPLVGDSAPVQ